MTGKMEGIPSINTNPLTNSFCNRSLKNPSKNICNNCYSKKMLRTYRKNCVNRFQQNSELLVNNVLKEIPKFRDDMTHMRFHSHGELINKEHLKNFYKIAEKNDHVTFALFTKRKYLVHKVNEEVESVPDNIVFIYSNPTIDDVNQEIPEEFHKTFTVIKDCYGGIENCKGKCKDCLECYKKEGTKHIYEKIK